MHWEKNLDCDGIKGELIISGGEGWGEGGGGGGGNSFFNARNPIQGKTLLSATHREMALKS